MHASYAPTDIPTAAQATVSLELMSILFVPLMKSSAFSSFASEGIKTSLKVISAFYTALSAYLPSIFLAVIPRDFIFKTKP